MVSSALPLAATLPSDLKVSNRRQILEKFRGGEALTANQIADEIGVSRQTVMKAIQFFTQKGLITSLGKRQSARQGGKPPELFSLAEDRYLLSIALWPDQLRLTLLNLRGETVAECSAREDLPKDVHVAMERIRQRSGELLQKCGREALLGVCVSTSGIVDYRTNALKFSVQCPAWGRDIPIAGLLRPCFGPDVPILLENVSKVVGRSILHREELDYKRMVVLFSSWGGICASFIEAGSILNGKDSLIGEIGHMVIAPDDPQPCGCGGHGCFERMVSVDRLRQRVSEEIASHPDSVLKDIPLDQLNLESLYAASASGDAYARQLSARMAKHYAAALRNISLVFDPELVVFQGECAAADEHFASSLRQRLSQFRYYPEGGPFEIRMDRRPLEELNVRGAHTLLIDRLLGNPDLYL